MTCFVHLSLAAAMTIGLTAAGAQTRGRESSNLPSTTGVVKAISASSLTVERSGIETKFAVDSSTRVFAKEGAKARDLVFRTPPPGIRDIIKVGDLVLVRYRRSGNVTTAVDVRIAQP